MNLAEENKIKELADHIKKGGDAVLVTTKQRRIITTNLGVRSIRKGEVTTVCFKSLKGGLWLMYLVKQNSGERVSPIPKHIKSFIDNSDLELGSV